MALLLLLSDGAAAADLSSRPAGTVIAWGAEQGGEFFGWAFGQSTVPEGLNDVVAVAGGRGFSLALRKNGTVVAWGDNRKGQCRVPEGLEDVVAVAAGIYDFSLALRSDGTVVAWGDNQSGQCTVPEGLNDVVAIAGATATSFALKSDGTVVALFQEGGVYAWGGSNEHGELDVPHSAWSGVTAIAASGHCLALKEDGTVVAWGQGEPGKSRPYDVGQSCTNIRIATGVFPVGIAKLVVQRAVQFAWRSGNSVVRGRSRRAAEVAG